MAGKAQTQEPGFWSFIGDIAKRFAFGDGTTISERPLGNPDRNMIADMVDLGLGPYNVVRGLFGREVKSPPMPGEEGWEEYANGLAMGVMRPIRGPNGLSFQFHDPLPTAPKPGAAIQKIIKENLADPRNANPDAVAIADQVASGKMSPLEAEAALKGSRSSIFDDIAARATGQRDRQVFNEKFGEYSDQRRPVCNAGNEKIGTANISGLDSSKGCITGNCVDCYGLGGSNQAQIQHMRPIDQTWRGKFNPDKPGLTRIGETGEPALDATHPVLDEIMAIKRSGKPLSQAQIDEMIKPAVNWRPVVDKMVKAGFDSPEAATRHFFVSKLPGVEGFDPSVIRNLHVSLDPMNPDHLFRAMRNAEAIQGIDPTVNMVARLKSLPTLSDEINANQLIATAWANQRGIPILDTRTRFKGGDSLRAVQADPSTATFSNQQGDPSYAFRLKTGDMTAPQIRELTKDNAVGGWFHRFLGGDDAAYSVCNASNDYCGTCFNCYDIANKGTPFKK